MSNAGTSTGTVKLLPKANFPMVRRMLAAIVAAQAFCALGSGRAASSTHGYIVLLAIVFTPVACIWRNARPRRINRILEGIGWALLAFLWMIATGSM